MDPERWQQASRILEIALERHPGRWAAYLDEVCANDAELRQEVESLLTASANAGSLLDSPAMAIAAPLFGNDPVKTIPGQSIGRYKIVTALGEGGMGEVYLAHDTRLGRKVALKLLSTHFTTDKDRLRRFEQEAHAASTLSHPNICMIHEVGETEDARHFIAMEYIDGVTLRERMTEARMKLSEVLEVAVQAASGLAASHEVGVVHRDIKPENIMLRHDGYVKVLDFGLAKLTEQPTSDVTTLAGARVRTDAGVVMGTSRYMSPEQTRGLTVDTRTDIWSLGVVLYEMVTGVAPFEGATKSDVIVSVLGREPSSLISHLPEVPAELQRIVSKALRKEREERYEVVNDMLLDLKSLKQELEFEARLQHSAQPKLSSDEIGSAEVIVEALDSVGRQTKEVQTTRTTSSTEFPNRKPLLWAAGLLGGLLLIAAGAWYLSRLITEPGPTHPTLTAVPLTTDLGYEDMPSLSPDGSQVAFGSFGEKLDNLDIYVKQIGGGPPLRLTSDPAVDKYPAWSPDGRSIAFIRERGDKQEVLLIPALGGPERKLAQIAWSIYTWFPPYLSWSPDSKYLVTVDHASPEDPPGLFVLSVATGEKQRLTTPPAPTLADSNPAVSPDGRTLAFVRVISEGKAQLYLLPLSEDCRPTGEARFLDIPQPWVRGPAWTPDGREIICEAGPSWIGGTLWRISISGSDKPVSLASLGKTSRTPTFSRQGNRLVYVVWNSDVDIWRAEVSGRYSTGPAEKLIASTLNESNPQYSPSGSRIAFSSNRSGNEEIWVCNSDGSNPVQLTSLESTSRTPRWFPDGRRIVFDSINEKQLDIYVIDTDTRVPRRLTSDASDNSTPNVSHDGKWIYFSSTRTGRWEIWRMPAEGGEAVQVTHQGGCVPFESPDGKVVYYQKTDDDSDLWKVAVAGGEETRVIGPAGNLEFAVVADGIYFIAPNHPGYAGLIKGNPLKFFSFTKGAAENVLDIKYLPWAGLSVSPDGRYVLFTQRDALLEDLMLVENFR
jgi:serine/threonine protein kinase/Tol biopolymer transport system component